MTLLQLQEPFREHFINLDCISRIVRREKLGDKEQTIIFFAGGGYFSIEHTEANAEVISHLFQVLGSCRSELSNYR